MFCKLIRTRFSCEHIASDFKLVSTQLIFLHDTGVHRWLRVLCWHWHCSSVSWSSLSSPPPSITGIYMKELCSSTSSLYSILLPVLYICSLTKFFSALCSIQTFPSVHPLEQEIWEWFFQISVRWKKMYPLVGFQTMLSEVPDKECAGSSHCPTFCTHCPQYNSAQW